MVSGGVSADELAAVLASLSAPAAPPVVAPAGHYPPVDARVTDAAGVALAEALGNPAAPRYYIPPRPTPYRCRVCGGELDAFHATLGTHPACDPEPAPAEQPPDTMPDLCEALVEYENARPRTRQVELGPSELGVACERRLAYSMRLPELPDGRVKWAPMLGTAAHKMLADAMRFANERLGRVRYLIEETVWPDPSVHGDGDIYDLDTDTVIDWKLVNPAHIKPQGPRGGKAGKYRVAMPAEYEAQVNLYGLGHQRAGRTPRWVRIVFLPRASFIDDAWEWTAPYSRRIAEQALDRMYRVMAHLTDVDIDHNPGLWAALPEVVDEDCRWCPWYRRGGPPDATGCPGDVAADEARDRKFDDGLIPPKTTEESAP